MTTVIRNYGTRDSIPQPATVKLRCDQNRIFGCGRLNAVPVTYTPIGVSALAMNADGRCECGLHLVKVQTLYPRDADRCG